MTNDQSGTENSSNTSLKVAIGVAVGCLVAVLCLVGGAISGVGGLVWLAQPPDDISVTVNAPTQVEIGQEVRLEVIVLNNSSQTSELSSIDISTGYLDGVVISSSTPPYQSTSQYESLGVQYQTYYFDQTIPSGGSLTVILTGEAILTGDHTGEIDVCVGSDFSCINNILRTLVR